MLFSGQISQCFCNVFNLFSMRFLLVFYKFSRCFLYSFRSPLVVSSVFISYLQQALVGIHDLHVELLYWAPSVQDVVHRVLVLAPPLHHRDDSWCFGVAVTLGVAPPSTRDGRHVELQDARDHRGVQLNELPQSNLHHVLGGSLEHARNALFQNAPVPVLLAVLVGCAKGDGVHAAAPDGPVVPRIRQVEVPDVQRAVFAVGVP